MELKGKLIVKGDIIHVSDTFQKREFVIEIPKTHGESSWVEYAKFQLLKDNCDRIEQINIGESINVSFNVKGNKWEKNGKVNYFNNLDAWKIERVQDGEVVTNDTPADLPF